MMFGLIMYLLGSLTPAIPIRIATISRVVPVSEGLMKTVIFGRG
jgi:hypothetical protein